MYHEVIDTPNIPSLHPDFLVIGAGVAGLRAAIELAPAGQVLVLAKSDWKESSSEYAQGGIAVALSDDDEVELHEQDTLVAGDGLCNQAAVHTLVEEAPAAIEELIAWGAEFDREGSKLMFGREGAHSRNRILHAHGDSTGREILRSLWHKASTFPTIRVLSFTAITELLLREREVVGAVAFDGWAGQAVSISAKSVLLATGGLGRVYQATTNPDVATGDGVAMAYRAGAEISDIEFVQFHPTALYLPGAPCFLLSEALRGEGAYLRNDAGERFMERYHELGELASRDIVSRSIVQEIRRTGSRNVWLDLTHKPAGFARSHFPRIYETCLKLGIDLEKDQAPVHPAAHYAMGGVRTDLDGATSLERLFAAGEVACTGVHGANRLASNSLLEGLVYGARAGRKMREHASSFRLQADPYPAPAFPLIEESELRVLAWNQLGIMRDAAGLTAALDRLNSLEFETRQNSTRQQFELRSLFEAARLIARCALARRESRGGHTRTDFPDHSEAFCRHSLVQKDRQDVSFYERG